MKRILSVALLLVGVGAAAKNDHSIVLSPLGVVHHAGAFNTGVSEISTYDPTTKNLFVVNGGTFTVDIVNINNPASPTITAAIPMAPYGLSANSVAAKNGVVAVAVEATTKQNPGKVVFFDSYGNFLSFVTVGSQPDHVVWSPNGELVMSANEGEPNADFTNDPEGSVSIVRIPAGGVAALTNADVTTVSLATWAGPIDASTRVFGPNASFARSSEPEYITISHDSKTAWISLQEANAIAIMDIPSNTYTAIKGLGFKDHMLAGNGLDPSDRDNAIAIANWPVKGMYLPDNVVSFRVKGNTYLITANEGDTRDFPPFYTEEARVGGVALDPTAFPNAAFLKNNARLGRLKVTNSMGDTDHDGDFDELYSFGARSFSVRDADGNLLWDSGDQFEQITAAANPAGFNADHIANAFDQRSDDKGPEPEGCTVGKVNGKQYAFIGLERLSGIMVYNVDEPSAPEFVQFITTRNFAFEPATGLGGDTGPEGLKFISEDESPNGKPLLVVTHEVTGTTRVLQIDKVK